MLVGGPGFEPGASRSRTVLVACPPVSRRLPRCPPEVVSRVVVVQIPGPRPVFEFKACLLFLYESAAATASKSRITPVAWRPLVFAGVRRRSTQVAADGPVSGPPALHGTERHLELRHDEPQMREGSHASRVNAVRGCRPIAGKPVRVQPAGRWRTLASAHDRLRSRMAAAKSPVSVGWKCL